MNHIGTICERLTKIENYLQESEAPSQAGKVIRLRCPACEELQQDYNLVRLKNSTTMVFTGARCARNGTLLSTDTNELADLYRCTNCDHHVAWVR